MTGRARHLLRDSHGSSAVEFSIAVPILIMMIWGLFQIGLIFQANAGMQHALGEGARYATIYDVTQVNRRPTDAAIQAKITSYKFGVANGTWGTPTITTDDATATKTITVTYSQPLNFLFFSGPTVTLTKTKTVYLSE
ncbi:MAG TPA: TadE/TadG family type IV pilus assembly protein [Sphingomicrobium sp.]|nr:TadE/TadG family type IV pilus assembly protein [Sphingomicrobium sp.]